jgi:hypothetical protein
MDRDQAIARIYEITSGSGVDRQTALAVIQRGEIAERHWNDGLFTLGIEYGYLLALVDVFNLTAADIAVPGKE